MIRLTVGLILEMNNASGSSKLSLNDVQLPNRALLYVAEQSYEIMYSFRIKRFLQRTWPYGKFCDLGCWYRHRYFSSRTIKGDLSAKIYGSS